MGEKMTLLSDLLDELSSVSAMIGYATSGAERNNHKAARDKIKAEILAHITQPAQAVDVEKVREERDSQQRAAIAAIDRAERAEALLRDIDRNGVLSRRVREGITAHLSENSR